MRFIIHTDGGSRGNPGPSAIGVIIEQEDASGQRTTIFEISKFIGETTNNNAEYTAVWEALQKLFDHCLRSGIQRPDIDVFLDSRLAVNQLNGMFKVKDPTIREKIARIRVREQELGGDVTYTLVPRGNNTKADVLVNRALDAR